MPERSTTSVVIALTTRVVVILLILAMGVGGFVVLWATSGEVAVSDDQAEAPTVPVFKLQRVNVREQWLGQGVAEALDSADLPARVSSTVAWIADDALPGARVKAGDPLILRVLGSRIGLSARLARLVIVESCHTICN